jgi:hypothetical protein
MYAHLDHTSRRGHAEGDAGLADPSSRLGRWTAVPRGRPVARRHVRGRGHPAERDWRDYLSLGLRGQAGLPTILAAGPPITSLSGLCHFLGGTAAPTIEGVRAAVCEHAVRGVDVIKIMASGGSMTPGSRQDLVQFPPEVLRAAVDEAHRVGLPVTAHAHAVAAIADAVAAGVDGLEHVSFWTEDGVDAPASWATARPKRCVRSLPPPPKRAGWRTVRTYRTRIRRRLPRGRRRPDRRSGRAAPHPGGLRPRRRCALQSAAGR